MSQPIAAVQKASVDAFFNLAIKSVDAGSRLTQLTFEVARSMLTQAQQNTLAVLSSRETGEVVASQARQADSIPDTVGSYALKLFDIATSVQAEFNRCAQTQVDAHKERMQTFIDQLAKNAPAGSEATVNAWKSAMETTRSFYETMQKNYQLAAQEATRTVSATAKATRHAAGQAPSAAKH